MSDETKIIDFSGDLKYEMIQSLISELTQKISIYDFTTAVRKKILNISVECLENIYKYTDNELYKNTPNFQTKFSVIKQADEIIISSGNILLTETVEKIKARIDKVNNSTREELFQAYEEVINSGEISKQGGAGLGFIDMALKSGTRFQYAFTDVENNLFYYEFKVKIEIK